MFTKQWGGAVKG